MYPSAVAVHYFETGIQKTIAAEMRLPTYFDKIVVSIVHRVLPRPAPPSLAVRSLRDAARFGYHTALGIEAALRAPSVKRRRVFDTRIWEPNNMSHLLLDLIPYSLYVRHHAGPEVDFLFRRMKRPFRDLLNLFDIVPDFERRRIEADVVRISGTRGLAVHDFDLRNTFDCPGIALVPNVYGNMDFRSSVKFEKVFLARRGARRLLNHSQIEQIVTRYGYETIYMEDYSLSEQLSIGAQAKHVVAIHGAAMSFLVMGRRIDSIIEFLPANNYAACFPLSLGSRVGRYDQIIPVFDRTVAHSGWSTIARFKDMPFAIDAGLLDKLLASIH